MKKWFANNWLWFLIGIVVSVTMCLNWYAEGYLGKKLPWLTVGQWFGLVVLAALIRWPRWPYRARAKIKVVTGWRTKAAVTAVRRFIWKPEIRKIVLIGVPTIGVIAVLGLFGYGVKDDVAEWWTKRGVAIEVETAQAETATADKPVNKDAASAADKPVAGEGIPATEKPENGTGAQADKPKESPKPYSDDLVRWAALLVLVVFGGLVTFNKKLKWVNKILVWVTYPFRGIGKLGGLDGKALIIVLATFAIFNAAAYWLLSDDWDSTLNKASRTFWGIQAVGALIAFLWIANRRKDRLAKAVIMAVVVTLISLFVANNDRGELLQNLKEERRVAAEYKEANIVKSPPNSGTLFWRKPEDAKGRFPNDRSDQCKVKILRNDEEVMDLLVYNNNGKFLHQMQWVKSEAKGKFFGQGMRPDEGEWELKENPASPGTYTGSYWGPGTDWKEGSITFVLDR